eukprot:GHVS01062835.1.p1 GENE.GHVS01062835.1~~GHVS01062835.1.p1  ORF type:complete len:1182 (+),score=220.59 GHVS01062835.1:120-3548(+)
MAASATVSSDQQQEEQKICSALAATTAGDASLRQQGETFLNSLTQSYALANVLIDILKHTQIEESTRISAAVLLKNEIRKCWSDRADNKNGYSEDDKQRVRSVLYQLLRDLTRMEQPMAIRGQVVLCIWYVVFNDFPAKWPELLPAICADLAQRSDKHGLLAALQTLRKVAGKYETKMSDESGHLDEIIQKTFPLLLDTSAALAQEGMGNVEAMMMLKLICKTYWSCTQLCLSKCGLVYNTLDLWMELMNHIILAKVPSETIVGDVGELPQFKLKKWALNIVHRYFSRYVGSSPVVSKTSDSRLFADKYLKIWAPRHVQSCLDVLKSQQAGECVNSGRVVNLLLQYLMQSVEVGSLYTKFIKPNLDFLLLQVCLPLFCFTAADEEKWATDPVEFIRMQNDCITSYSDPREAAVEFVRWLGRFRGKDSIEKIGMFADVMLSDTNASDSTKSGALLMLGCVVSRLTSRKRQVHVEGFLQSKVLPLFSSPVKHLRWRSVWLYGNYLEHLRTQPTGLEVAYNHIFALCGDEEMPVRVEAGVQIKGFFKIKQPLLQELVRKSLGQLMERLFALMNDIDHEHLVATVSDIVREYENEVTPYARQLVTLLCAAVLRMMAKEVSQDEEMTQLSTLQTIKAVLASAGDTPNVYDELFPPLVPVLQLLLHPERLEFIDDACEIMAFLTLHSPPKTFASLWRLLQYLHLCVCGTVRGLQQPPPPQMGGEDNMTYSEGWAPDMIEQMVTPIWNLLSRDGSEDITGRGRATIIQQLGSVESGGATSVFEHMTDCASGGRPYVQLIMEMAQKAITVEIDAQRGVELLCGLYESYYCTTTTPGILDAVYTDTLQLIFDFLYQHSSYFSPTLDASTASSTSGGGGVRTRRQSAELAKQNGHCCTDKPVGDVSNGCDDLDWEDDDDGGDGNQQFDRCCEVWCLRLISGLILYNVERFFRWEQQEAVEKLFSYWITKRDYVKSFPDRKVYLLALARLIARVTSPTATDISTPLPAFVMGGDGFGGVLSAACLQSEGMLDLRKKHSLSTGGPEDIQEDTDDDDSEQELDDAQDAQQDERTRCLLDKLRNEQNDDDDSDGSDSSFEDDNDSDMRLVSLESFDELTTMASLFANMPDNAKQAVVKWIGVDKLQALCNMKPPHA